MVEVLSDATAAYDRGAKFAAYRLLPSLQEYLLVDIERRSLEVFRRQPQGWVLAEPDGAPPLLALHSVGLTLTAEDVFGDLDTPAATDAPGDVPGDAPPSAAAPGAA